MSENFHVAVAGATGQLGLRIARELMALGADITLLLRSAKQANDLVGVIPGARVCIVDFSEGRSLEEALRGVSTVVSAVNGLEPVIIEAQTALAKAAYEAGVKRFIPSDFAVDFRGLKSDGTNRNLDLRREFSHRLENIPLQATSILNGAFLDMLTGQMPIILFGIRRVLCVGRPNQKFDFTTIDDTARFTARAALDNNAPRWLKIAGDQISPEELVEILSDLSGKEFKLLRPMGLNTFDKMITITKAITPTSTAIYPAWQGMQYLRDMSSGAVAMQGLHNDRYGNLKMRSAKELLSSYLKGQEPVIKFA